MMRWLLVGALLVAPPAFAQEELSPHDFQLIADVVCWEARGEPFIDQADVARVVLNRMSAGNFGRTVSQIVYAPGQFSGFFPNRRAGECYRSGHAWWRASLAVIYEFYVNLWPHEATHFARCDLGRVFGPTFEFVKRNVNHCYYKVARKG